MATNRLSFRGKTILSRHVQDSFIDGRLKERTIHPSVDLFRQTDPNIQAALWGLIMDVEDRWQVAFQGGDDRRDFLMINRPQSCHMRIEPAVLKDGSEHYLIKVGRTKIKMSFQGQHGFE